MRGYLAMQVSKLKELTNRLNQHLKYTMEIAKFKRYLRSRSAVNYLQQSEPIQNWLNLQLIRLYELWNRSRSIPNRRACRCGECRYLFRKARADMNDKSYVNCGAVADKVVQIKPTPDCKNYKPLRKSQYRKRWKSKKH